MNIRDLIDSPKTNKTSPVKSQIQEGGENSYPTYCVCGSSSTDEFMIACDNCNLWCHGQCVGITDFDSERLVRWFCPRCLGNRYSGLQTVIKPLCAYMRCNGNSYFGQDNLLKSSRRVVRKGSKYCSDECGNGNANYLILKALRKQIVAPGDSLNVHRGQQWYQIENQIHKESKLLKIYQDDLDQKRVQLNNIVNIVKLANDLSSKVQNLDIKSDRHMELICGYKLDILMVVSSLQDLGMETDKFTSSDQLLSAIKQIGICLQVRNKCSLHNVSGSQKSNIPTSELNEILVPGWAHLLYSKVEFQRDQLEIAVAQKTNSINRLKRDQETYEHSAVKLKLDDGIAVNIESQFATPDASETETVLSPTCFNVSITS
ncbi:hypothetical protein MP228_010917 [Amoeboaphelidium protococcarum]|nr:hypothetical protein MP228_010917 [Amoeboaphelidium protococcarum]